MARGIPCFSATFWDEYFRLPFPFERGYCHESIAIPEVIAASESPAALASRRA